MEKVTQYRCSKCVLAYNTEEECKKCEESHIKPVELIRCIFADVSENSDGKLYAKLNTKLDMTYPQRLDIKMEDGTTVSYKPIKQQARVEKLIEENRKNFDKIMDSFRSRRL